MYEAVLCGQCIDRNADKCKQFDSKTRRQKTADSSINVKELACGYRLSSQCLCHTD